MQEFRNYLVSRRFITKKQSHFYQLWVKNLYAFIGKSPDSDVKNEDIDKYIRNITKYKQDWQVQQAQEAIRVYMHYKDRPTKPRVGADDSIKAGNRPVRTRSLGWCGGWGG